jgi:hypothetical protein
MKDYLTEAEVLKIEQFSADKAMFEAVKKVMLQYVYTQGVIKKGEKHNALQNRALVLVQGGVDDAELGRNLRALWEGVQAVEKGFNDLETIKSKKEDVESPYNEAI